MPRLPRMTYFVLLLLMIVIAALTGCQMPRDSTGDLTTTPPPTPTLASLGVDNTEMPLDATPVPTIINVQPTATPGLTGAGQEAEKLSELVAPTSQAPEMAITPIANPAQAAGPETFVPPADTGEQPVIVSAPSSDLPEGGPVAANPPAAQPSSYAVPATDNTGAAYGGSTYLVQAGDTLFAISMRYGTTVENFMYANGLTSDLIYEGQVLTVPTGGETSTYAAPPSYGQAPVDPTGTYNSGYYVVAPGDTLFSIAQWHGTSVEALAAANALSYPYIIYEGQTLNISGYGAPPANGFYNPQQEIQPYPADGYYQQPQQPAYPPSGIAGTHTVAPGETLFSIAQRYGTSAQAVAEANGLANPNQIYVGQVLYLP